MPLKRLEIYEGSFNHPRSLKMTPFTATFLRTPVDQAAAVVRVCILFLLYTAELLDIVVECGFIVHAYADDTQVYVSTQSTEESSAMERLTSCIVKIRDWMATNRLKMNEDKAQVIWLSTRYQLCKVTAQTLTLSNATVQFSTVVNDLGVLIDSELTMANHVAALSRSCFFQHEAAPVSQTFPDVGGDAHTHSGFCQQLT